MYTSVLSVTSLQSTAADDKIGERLLYLVGSSATVAQKVVGIPVTIVTVVTPVSYAKFPKCDISACTVSVKTVLPSNKDIYYYMSI